MNTRKEIDKQSYKWTFKYQCGLGDCGKQVSYEAGALYGFKLACELLKSEEAISKDCERYEKGSGFDPKEWASWLLSKLEEK